MFPALFQPVGYSTYKKLCNLTRIEEIRQTKNAVIFTYSQSMPPDIKVISELLKNESKGLMFSAGTKPYITLKHKGKDLLSNIKSLLQKYKQLQTSDK
jgi:hypothetical protein